MYIVTHALKVIEGKSRRKFKIRRHEERKRIQEKVTKIEDIDQKDHIWIMQVPEKNK